MTTPMPIRTTLAELHDVRLPDTTEVDWISVPVLDRVIDLMLEHGAEAEQLTEPGLASTLTALLAEARQVDGRWERDAFTLTTELGVTRVLVVAEHHDEHGWVLLLDVPA